METSEHPFVQQPGNNLLDVLSDVVMAGINQNFCPQTNLLCYDVGHAPIRQVGMIKGWLERLVFDQHHLVRIQSRGNFGKTLGHYSFAPSNICLARVVGTVSKPERKIFTAYFFCDLNAIEEMPLRRRASDIVAIANGAILVNLILKQIRIHRSQTNSELFRAFDDHQRIFTSSKIPKHVNGTARTATRIPMNLGCVHQSIVESNRGSILEKRTKPGAGIGKRPTCGLDLKMIEII